VPRDLGSKVWVDEDLLFGDGAATGAGSAQLRSRGMGGQGSARENEKDKVESELCGRTKTLKPVACDDTGEDTNVVRVQR
jgi:hypothetical protein